VITYTPHNPEGWKVEMGNTGLLSRAWRYEQVPTTTSSPLPTTTPTTVPTATTVPEPTPKVADLVAWIRLRSQWFDNGLHAPAAGTWKYKRNIDHYDPAPRYRFVVVDITMKNVNVDELYVNPLLVTLIDSSGREWDYDGAMNALGDYFKEVTLHKELTRQGE
jgi:hypothetical protein